GTSMATPHVYGALALVWSLAPNASADHVGNVLLSTATDLGARGFDTDYGFGLVNALSARRRLPPQGLRPEAWPRVTAPEHAQPPSTYSHIAPVPDLTQALLKKKITGVAYETITDERKRTLPLLTPMSEVAGRMSVHVGAYYLHKPNGGRGVLLGGVPGTLPADVIIIGGGVVGTNAAKMASGLGARVPI